MPRFFALIVATVAVISLQLVLNSNLHAERAARPNIIFVMADDQ